MGVLFVGDRKMTLDNLVGYAKIDAMLKNPEVVETYKGLYDVLDVTPAPIELDEKEKTCYFNTVMYNTFDWLHHVEEKDFRTGYQVYKGLRDAEK